MKFDIEAKVLLEAAGQSITSNIHQICQHILIDADGHLSVGSTDFETRLTLKVPASISESGRATCDPKLLRSILNGIDGKVSIESKDGCVLIRQDRRKLKLPSLNPDEFPEMPQDAAEPLSADNVAGAMDLVSYAAATRNDRIYLNGISLGQRIAASNGYLMAVAAGEFELPAMIVPINAAVKVIEALQRPGAVFGYVKNQQSPAAIVVRHDAGQVWARLIDARYPDIKPFTQRKYPDPVRFKADAALAAVNRLMPLVEQEIERRRVFSCDLRAADGLLYFQNEDNEEAIEAEAKTPHETTVDLSLLRAALSAIGDTVLWYPDKDNSFHRFVADGRADEHYIAAMRR